MSKNEMISVPEGYMLVERSIWTEQQVEAATACITRLKGVHGMRDRDLAMAVIDAAQCKAPDIALSDLLPAEQHQGEPVELPARNKVQHFEKLTRFEREVYAAGRAVGRNDCLEEIAKLGPLYTRPAPAVRWMPFVRGESEPAPGVEVLVRYAKDVPDYKDFNVIGAALYKAFDDMDTLFWFNGHGEAMRGKVSHWMPMPGLDVMPHANQLADAGEVERLRADLVTVKADRDAYAQNAIDLRDSLSRARQAHAGSQGLLQEQIDTLREALDECKEACVQHEAQVAEDFKHIDDLRAKLAERDALFARILGKRDACAASYWFEEIQALLSASAEPVSPSLVECDACPRTSGCVGACMKTPTDHQARRKPAEGL